MSTDAHDIQKEIKKYLAVFFALMVLTIITVAISRFHFPPHKAIILALLVATLKATLVAGVFMHLFHEKKAIYWTLILTVVCAIGLLLLPIGNAVNHLYGTHDTSKAFQMELKGSGDGSDEHHSEEAHKGETNGH